MGLIHPGLGEQLETLTGAVRGRESQTQDNPPAVRALKAVLSYALMALINLGWRDDLTHCLDYEEEDRTSDEQWIKRQVVVCLSQWLRLLRQPPARTWDEVTELEKTLGVLQAAEDSDWEPEIVKLGSSQGITVERQKTVNGVASFAAPEGNVTAYVYKALEPAVTLEGADVYLVRKLQETEFGYAGEGAGQWTAEYAVMVDDPYWGRRVQGAEFAAAPQSETLVMGYRLQGRVRQAGEPIAEANISLEGELEHSDGKVAVFWDSLEFNGLKWSETLETYVESAEVYAPIRTDETGRWEALVPKGHGALYQRLEDRRDDTPETAAEGLGRWLREVRMAYQGRQAVVSEGTEAELNLQSGQLIVRGEPGAWVKVGALDDPGETHLIQANGEAAISGLVEGEHSVVQFQLNSWGEWDSSYGCARQLVEVAAGETAEVDMGNLESYDPGGNVICGRVYERMGAPAVGVAIVPLNYESGEFGQAIATTDSGGYWEAEIPPEGLGGDPWIHNENWGTVPCLGFPYSEVVLGARAYAAWEELYKPEAWRKGDRGHANFQFVPETLWVKDNDSKRRFDSIEVAYGGWVTKETLPKYKHVADPLELLMTGPQLREYSLHNQEEVIQESFVLRAQAFSSYEDLPGQYRAAGYYPEVKALLGGKIKGSVVVGHDKAIENLPEAQRLGLEFGEHEWFVEVQQEGTAGKITCCLSDLVCPYCGGPAWRDPSGQKWVRGYCQQCALAFKQATAMDCRTHFVSPTLAAQNSPYQEKTVRVGRAGRVAKSAFNAHWRPDLYEERDDYLAQNGPGQATNAPRWFARHVHEVGDGKGFGSFDGDLAMPFVAGHDLEYFGALPGIQRDLGLTQMKVALPAHIIQEQDLVVEIDCMLGDNSIETVQVTIPAGLQGPNEKNPWGEVKRLKHVSKQWAEKKPAPHPGAGFFKGVADIRLVSPASAESCRFTVINDVPLLASVAGVTIVNRQPSHVALQIAEVGGRLCYIANDAAGNPLWLACLEGGGVQTYTIIEVDEWWPSPVVALTGAYQYPSIVVLDDGSIIAAATNTAAGRVDVVRSRNAGKTWEAVNVSFGANLENGCLFMRAGGVYLAGWYNDKVWLVTSSADNLAREELNSGGDKIIEVCEYKVTGDEKPVVSGVVANDGEVLVAVAGGGETKIYGCRNFGEGFTLQT